jgi:uncharacterized protein
MSLLIDTRELARTARTLEGTLDVSALPRLASLLSPPEGQLRWQVRGERHERPDGGHDDLMHAELAADVSMQCVRCLGAAPVALRVANSFRVVDSEEQAEREDLDDPEFDVIAGGRAFDLGALIEDEAIMGLPSVGRHEDCELPLGGATTDAVAHAAPDGAGEDPRTSKRQGPSGEDEAGARSDSDREDRIRPFADLAALTKRRH